jgi:membrane protein
MFPPLRLREAMRLGGLSIRELTVRTWCKMNDHEVLTRAAAIAFYAMLAFIPFLALTVTVLVQLLPDPTGRSGEPGIGALSVSQLNETIRDLFPKEAYEVVRDQISRLQKQPPVGLVSFGIIITLWLASSLFMAVIDAMNRIYGVNETRPYWKLRLVAAVMTVVQATILIGSLLAIVLWPLVVRRLGLSESTAILGELVQFFMIFVMLLLSFALAFYYGPDADQRWEWITPGSVAGTTFLLAVTYLFRLYIQHFANYDKTYGSLGGVMILLFWFWLSSVILLAAGQMNKVIEDASPLGKRYGQKVEPTSKPNFSPAGAEAS